MHITNWTCLIGLFEQTHSALLLLYFENFLLYSAHIFSWFFFKIKIIFVHNIQITFFSKAFQICVRYESYDYYHTPEFIATKAIWCDSKMNADKNI